MESPPYDIPTRTRDATRQHIPYSQFSLAFRVPQRAGLKGGLAPGVLGRDLLDAALSRISFLRRYRVFK